MRPALSHLLHERYKDLYLWHRKSPPHFSILCDDGWFSIVDALSETILSLDAKCVADEVDTERGLLRFKCFDWSTGVNTSIRAAANFSGLVCEMTGYRGGLSLNENGFYKSVSLEVLAKLNETTEKADDHDASHHPNSYVQTNADKLLALAHEQKTWSKEKVDYVLRESNDHALTPDCVIDIPVVGFDLTHAVIRSMKPRLPGRQMYPGVASLKIRGISWLGKSGLFVDVDPASLVAVAQANFETGLLIADIIKENPSLEKEIETITSQVDAVCLFGRNMSRRIDLETGRIGPVDDQGHLIGAH